MKETDRLSNDVKEMQNNARQINDDIDDIENRVEKIQLELICRDIRVYTHFKIDAQLESDGTINLLNKTTDKSIKIKNSPTTTIDML